jgi:hypothetical protein
MEDKLTATAYLLAPEGERRGEIVEGVVKGMCLIRPSGEGTWMSLVE